MKPLLHHDADISRGETADERRKPEAIQPYRIRLNWSCQDSLKFDHGMGGVNKCTRGVDGEAVELKGDLLQHSEGRVRGNGLEEVVRLDVECSEDGREQSCLLRPPLISDPAHVAQLVTHGL